jgi:hypothetical protein
MTHFGLNNTFQMFALIIYISLVLVLCSSKSKLEDNALDFMNCANNEEKYHLLYGNEAEADLETGINDQLLISSSASEVVVHSQNENSFNSQAILIITYVCGVYLSSLLIALWTLLIIIFVHHMNHGKMT